MRESDALYFADDLGLDSDPDEAPEDPEDGWEDDPDLEWTPTGYRAVSRDKDLSAVGLDRFRRQDSRQRSAAERRLQWGPGAGRPTDWRAVESFAENGPGRGGGGAYHEVETGVSGAPAGRPTVGTRKPERAR